MPAGGGGLGAGVGVVGNRRVRKTSLLIECSLRSKRFPLVSEQRKTKERDSWFWTREMKQEPKNESGSFFAPKAHGNACYAG